MTYQKDVLENIWLNFAICGIPQEHNQNCVPCLQQPNCSTTSRTDSFKWKHENKARSPFRICKTGQHQKGKQSQELRQGLQFPLHGSSHKGPHSTNPCSQVLKCQTAKKAHWNHCRPSLFTAGLNTSTQLRALKSSSGLRPKYPVFYSIMSIKRIIKHLFNTLLCSVSIPLTAHLFVSKITCFTVYAS